MTQKLLTVENLSVTDPKSRRLVSNLSFTLERGAVLAVTGPSGAGKSLSMRAVCGLCPPGFHVGGQVRFGTQSDADRILYLVQQAFGAFDPMRRIGRQLEEMLRGRRPELTAAQARRRVLEVLESLGFGNPERCTELFACEMSGGMLQRAVTACAILLEPTLIVADEPTSALDAPGCVRIAQRLAELAERTGAALVVITHDAAFASLLTENFLVIEKGKLVEQGTLSDVRRRPASYPLLDALLTADRAMSKAFETIAGRQTPHPTPTQPPATKPPLVEVQNLTHRIGGGFFRSHAAHTVFERLSLRIAQGERVGLAARSGQGKSTLARYLLGLEHDRQGAVRIQGMSAERFARRHPGQMAVISQNYTEAVDPMLSVAQILAEPVELALTQARAAEREKLSALLAAESLIASLARVGLGPELLGAHARSLSGGELQRVCIARALITSPRFVVFDEALSSLDALVQSRVLTLIDQAAAKGAAWLFIDHDMRVLARLCERILFLDEGHIVEDVPVDRLLSVQSHAAKELVAAALERHFAHPTIA